MTKKHHTKLDWKGALVWANLLGQFVTSQISRSAIGSIFLEKSYWMREEGRPCVSLISRQFSSGRPVVCGIGFITLLPTTLGYTFSPRG